MPRKAQKSTEKKDRLSPQKRKAIELIMLGKRFKEVYEEVGVSKSTLESWRKQKIFGEELAKLEVELEEESVTRLKALQEKALTTLEEILEDKNVSPGVRARTAIQVLSIASEESKRGKTIITIEDLDKYQEQIYGFAIG